MKTEAWWVCNVCDTKIKKVGKKQTGKFEAHRKVCPKATCSMKQVKQGK